MPYGHGEEKTVISFTLGFYKKSGKCFLIPWQICINPGTGLLMGCTNLWTNVNSLLRKENELTII